MFFPKIKFGEALVFNPFVYHGSIHHKNKRSRISLDVRLQRLDRPLFQKYNDFLEIPSKSNVKSSKSAKIAP